MALSSRHRKLLMFDLDGTLIDTLPDIADAVDEAFASLGFTPPGEEKARGWVGNGSKKLLQRALASELDCPEHALPRDLLERLQNRFFDAYQTRCAVRSALYPGVYDTLQQLQAQGKVMACVTNKPSRFTPCVLSGMAIDQFFALSISGDSLARRKPDPLPLHHVMQYFQVGPGESLMIGDSRNDIEAARAAGVDVICVDYGYNYHEPVQSANPDMVVGSLLEMLPYLTTTNR